MYCSKCGEKLLEDSNFCRNCGNNASEQRNAQKPQKTQNPQESQDFKKPDTKNSKAKYLLLAIPIAIVLVLSIAFIAQKSGSSMNPEKVTSTFFEGIEKKDSEKIKEVMLFEEMKEVEAMDFGEWDEMFAGFNEGMSEKFGLDWYKKLQFTTSKETINEAIVLIGVKDNPETIKADLIKEGEDWKIENMDI